MGPFFREVALVIALFMPQDSVVQQTVPLMDQLFEEHVEWFDESFGDEEAVILRARYGYYVTNLAWARPDENMLRLYEDIKECAADQALELGYLDEFVIRPFIDIRWLLFDNGWILDYEANFGNRISGVVLAGKYVLVARAFTGKPQTMVHEIFHLFFPGLWHSEPFYYMLNQCIREVW